MKGQLAASAQILKYGVPELFFYQAPSRFHSENKK